MAKGIKKLIKEIWRYPLCRSMRRKLHNHGFSILSQNCMGGLLTHDLGERFNSPTVNMSMRFPDYIKFIENIDYYLKEELVFFYMKEAIPWDYPVCKLGDLTLYMVHYHTFQEAKEKWDIRKQRIDKDNLFLMCTDREGFTEELLEKFLNIPYPKVCFVHENKDWGHPEVIYIPGYETETEVGDIVSKYCGLKGHRIFEKYFDCVKWLNSKEMMKE